MKTSPLAHSSRRLVSSHAEARPRAASSLARALSGGALGVALVAALGCGDSSASSGGGGGTTTAGTGTGTGGTGGAEAGTVTDVRGDRYCEILVGKLGGAQVHIDVYNTYLLNDCPQDAWAAVDAAQVKSAQMADVVVLNGPRYWLMDAFTNSALVDPTPHTLGGLEMRLAGTLELPLAQAMGGGGAPYESRDVNRTTTWIYQAGKPVYELVDPGGRVFDMQSYSVQTTPQTQGSLAGLGATLALPAGWQFRSRVLVADLHVTAVNGVATVVQDDLANTYQLSQQAP